ncbi:MAG TPA: hypothetical protein VE642_14040 [Pyrinomonadaceae bacterium]|jgi:hypothetical protein|nr:hypothetical protein [Pyrinomonadaceae bacterium]
MQIVRGLDEEFARLHGRSMRLVRAVPFEKLYWQPPRTEAARARAFPVYSCGEHVLRSAAAVEQTFGGITVNLWDDPFEWTLPEALPAPSDVARYLEEAEATRLRAFQLFKSDEDLAREIAAPSGEMRTLFALAAEALARASHHQGRAYATFRLFSDERLPRV